LNVDQSVARFNASDDAYGLNQELGLSLPISQTSCAAGLDFENSNLWMTNRRKTEGGKADQNGRFHDKGCRRPPGV